MNNFLKNIAALINVKTIVTFIVTAVFCVLAIRGDIDSASALTIITMVMGFYFGTQTK